MLLTDGHRVAFATDKKETVEASDLGPELLLEKLNLLDLVAPAVCRSRVRLWVSALEVKMPFQSLLSLSFHEFCKIVLLA